MIFMSRILFIGLGIMGAPMARNLLKAGFSVSGSNRSQAKVDAFVTDGGSAAADLDVAARDADIIATMLPDSPDVRAVLSGDHGILAQAKPGTLVIDFSTIEPAVARELCTEARARGVRMLDAPVSGGEAGAIDGTLSVMVGGAAEYFDAARPVFEAVGQAVVHVGPSGSGQTVKAANQLIVAGTIELLAEAIVFLEASGVDAERALAVLGGGLAGSAVLARKGPSMLARAFKPGFRIELHHKDMGIVTSAARAAGVTIPLGAAAAQLIGALNSRGDGGLDHGALLKLADQLSGRHPSG